MNFFDAVTDFEFSPHICSHLGLSDTNNSSSELVRTSFVQNILSILFVYPVLLLSTIFWYRIAWIFQDSEKKPFRKYRRRNVKQNTVCGFVRKWMLLSHFMMNNDKTISNVGYMVTRGLPTIYSMYEAHFCVIRIQNLVHMTPAELWKYQKYQWENNFANKNDTGDTNYNNQFKKRGNWINN